MWRGSYFDGVKPWLNILWRWILGHCRKVCCLALWVALGGFSSGLWYCILYGCRWSICLGEVSACGWRSMCLIPSYLWLLGRCVQSYFPLSFSILVCQPPSLGACILGIFHSLEKWLRPYVLEELLLLMLYFGVYLVFSCYMYHKCGYWYWRLSGRRDLWHMAGHEIATSHSSWSCIIYVYQL